MILSALALFAASCGDGGDVRVVALTPTPASEQTPVRSIDGPATIITATPTAGPIEGTATPTATVTASADEPPEPPKRPEQPLASALLLRDYLATGEANLPGCLPELVSAWELAPTSGARCLFADFDGDGASEFAFAVTLADGGGDIWFYESAEDEYRLLTSARVLLNATLDGVTIDAIADLTGDRFPDLVISALRCGDAGCERQLLIVSTHRGRLENLAPAGLEISPNAGLSVEEVDAASAGATGPETPPRLVIMDDAVSNSPTGPVRSTNLVLSWVGAGFLSEEEPGPTRYLFHAIVDADEAFRRGEYGLARALYEAAAATDTSLVDWRVEQGQGSGRAELSAYALFRAALSAQRMQDEAGMLTLLNQAVDNFGAALHGEVAAIYRQGVETELAPGLICSEIGRFLRTRERTFRSIWNYGPHNPSPGIGELCS